MASTIAAESSSQAYRSLIVCTECNQLLRSANLAIQARQMALAKLTDIRSTGEVDEVALIQATVELSIVALAAWDEYRNHVKQHE